MNLHIPLQFALAMTAASVFVASASAQNLVRFVNNTVANAADVNNNFDVVAASAGTAQTTATNAEATANSAAATATSAAATANAAQNSVNGLTNVLRVASGNVGIGVTSPGERLDIAGNFRLRTDDRFYFDTLNSNTDPLYLKRENAASNITRLRMVLGDDPAPGTGITDEFVISTSVASSDRFVFDSAGTLKIFGSGAVTSGGTLQFGDASCFNCVYLKEVADDQLRINAGLIGLRRDPTSNTFEVEGNASKSTSGSWLANSDARIKTDVVTVNHALTTLDKVRLVSFRYSDWYREQHPTLENRAYLNVIAQEFQQVFPEHVQSSGEKLPDGNEILQVDIHPLTIYTAAGVQELHSIVQDQAQKLARLEAQNARLAEQVGDLATMQQELASLKATLAGLAAGK